MEQMQMLSIDKAITLYQLLNPHLPDEIDDGLDYVSHIVKSMEVDPAVYLGALVLMTGIVREELIEKEIDELLELFVSGLGKNNVATLRSFCVSLGFDND